MPNDKLRPALNSAYEPSGPELTTSDQGSESGIPNTRTYTVVEIIQNAIDSGALRIVT